MSMINYASREINCKIVYYGPGLGGKTTNLEFVYGRVSPDTRGKLISLATETERTLFFDFLPVDLGTIRGFRTRFHLYTVPGQVYYNASRKLILKGVDGVVFVADSQQDRAEANLESMQNLYDNMAAYGYDLTRLPFVIQYNKRDLPNAAPLAELQEMLNPGWEVLDAERQRPAANPFRPDELLVRQLPTGEWVERAPAFEAVAVSGDGVFETLKAVSKLVLKTLA
jgi:signal recognition particle receptor subunit beta